MPRLIYAPASLQDIARLRGFLHRRDPQSAKRAVAEIRASLKKLALRPHIGRPAKDLPAGFREWFIRFGDSGYVALYRLDEHDVLILAVRHVREAGF